MKSSIAVLLLSLFLIPVGRSLAQQSPDPKQAELIAYAHFKALTPAEQNQLLSMAQLGDAGSAVLDGRAQYRRNGTEEFGSRPPMVARNLRNRDNALAQRAYGLTTVHSDAPVGERWMLRAAEQGDAEAQFWLGFGYEQNWFRTTDVNEAVKWYQKAAQGGDPDAQVELGHRYEYGEGVEQSFKLAAEWYRRAAEHVPDLGGAGQGKNQLGVLYLEGRGVPRDYVQAYFWFSLKGSKENAAEAREHLNPAQIRGVERLIDEWKQYHRPSPELAAALHTMAPAERTYVTQSDGGGTRLIPTTESKLPSVLESQPNPEF